jgi:hypothetical protein
MVKQMHRNDQKNKFNILRGIDVYIKGDSKTAKKKSLSHEYLVSKLISPSVPWRTTSGSSLRCVDDGSKIGAQFTRNKIRSPVRLIVV